MTKLLTLASPGQTYCIASPCHERWIDGPFDAFDEAKRALAGQDAVVCRVMETEAARWLPSVDDLCDQMSDDAYNNGCGSDEHPVIEVVGDKEQAAAELRAWAEKWLTMNPTRFVGEEVVGPE